MPCFFFQLHSVLSTSAKTVTIVVGGNGTTQDASLIFQPQEVTADVGDSVVFNCTSALCLPPSLVLILTIHAHASALDSVPLSRCLIPVTNGTHSAVESTFAEPCTPIHDTNITMNGFNPSENSVEPERRRTNPSRVRSRLIRFAKMGCRFVQIHPSLFVSNCNDTRCPRVYP